MYFEELLILIILSFLGGYFTNIYNSLLRKEEKQRKEVPTLVRRK